MARVKIKYKLYGVVEAEIDDEALAKDPLQAAQDVLNAMDEETLRSAVEASVEEDTIWAVDDAETDETYYE